MKQPDGYKLSPAQLCGRPYYNGKVIMTPSKLTVGIALMLLASVLGYVIGAVVSAGGMF